MAPSGAVAMGLGQADSVAGADVTHTLRCVGPAAAYSGSVQLQKHMHGEWGQGLQHMRLPNMGSLAALGTGCQHVPLAYFLPTRSHYCGRKLMMGTVVGNIQVHG